MPERLTDRDGQPEDGEGHDLGQTGQAGGEVLDLALVRRARVADEDPRQEHRQETRAVGHRRHAVHQQGERDRAQRVERLVGHRQVTQDPAQREAAGRSVDQLAKKENEVIIGLLRLRASAENGASNGTAK